MLDYLDRNVDLKLNEIYGKKKVLNLKEGGSFEIGDD